MASAANSPSPVGTRQGLSFLASLSDDIIKLVDAVRPSVVQVLVHQRGAGAGVVWDTDGGVITNHHVVGDVDEVEVRFSDGRSAPAKVARRQPAADLALLQIPAGGLEPATVGDSAQLRVGELVFAIGHPWGLRDVVTAGIVSGTGDVEMRWNGRSVELIRSDVRLAPGNSGGPLIDASGRVIGINSMILGGDLSVAVPSTVVQKWLASAGVPRPFLGLELRPVELRSHSRRGPARAAGLMVSGIRPHGPAEQAGLLLGDVLVGLDGAPLPHPSALSDALTGREPGEVALLDVVRGGIVQRVDLRLGAAQPA